MEIGKILPPYSSTVWKAIGAVAGLIALVGLFLFLSQVWGDWRFESKQNKIKANVNAALANIAEGEKVIANLKQDQAVKVEAVNIATREWVNAQGYTDETKREVNKALGNLANAAKGNANISVKELEEKLRGL